jgi:hypothetical protein
MKLDSRGYHFSPMQSQQSFFTMAATHDSTSSQLHEINIDGLREVERNQNVEQLEFTKSQSLIIKSFVFFVVVLQ